jgi:acyl-CoA thioester hydrolase
VLNYKIFRKETKELIAEGQTTQVFTDFDGNLVIYTPDFYNNWKQKWGIK